MALDDKLVILLQSCVRCVESSRNLWMESQESVRVTKDAVSASQALIAESDKTIERLRMLTLFPLEHSKPKQSNAQPDRLEIVADRTFEDELVVLDGRHFLNCTLINCVLQYCGQPVIFETTSFHECQFQFGAEAALTVQLMECFGLVLPETKVQYSTLPYSKPRPERVN